MIDRPEVDAIVAEVEAAFEEEADFLASLIAARSPTGNEGPAAEVLLAWLEAEGFEAEAQTIPEEVRDRHPALAGEHELELRPNVFGWWRGPGGGERPLVLNGHLDVVPADESEGWTRTPFAAERSGGRVWGRGATDMKGGVVTALFAIRALRRLGFRPNRDVQIQGVIAEETGGLGTLAALECQPLPGAAVVLEPTDNLVAPVCGGNLEFRVFVEGAAVHTSVPWAGVSAAEKLWAVYGAIQAFSDRRNSEISNPFFAHLPEQAPAAVGVFQAGDYPSTVPAKGTLAGRVGLMPGDSISEVKEALAAALSGIDDPWLQAHPPQLEWIHEGFAAWETPADAEIVRAMDAGYASVNGESRLGAVTYGSDAGHFARRGVPTVLFGPGSIVDAHQVDESLAESDLRSATKVLACGLARFLGCV